MMSAEWRTRKIPHGHNHTHNECQSCHNHPSTGGDAHSTRLRILAFELRTSDFGRRTSCFSGDPLSLTLSHEGRGNFPCDPIHPHRLGNVLDRLLTQVFIL